MDGYCFYDEDGQQVYGPVVQLNWLLTDILHMEVLECNSTTMQNV